MKEPIAILASDIHLSLRPPVWRSVEPDWFEAMGRQLDELRVMSGTFFANSELPIIYAGDIFDRWFSSPELINFAIDRLPKGYAIPGQHDLPNHRSDLIKKSAYWTLVEAGTLTHIWQPMLVKETAPLMIHPFEWGKQITPMDARHRAPGRVNLAVIHSYIWIDGSSYKDADEEKKAGKYRKSLTGYDAAVFGDNHKGFIIGRPGAGSLMAINCGTFFRRTSDEESYHPQIGILYEDGSIEPHYLDVSKDVFEKPTKRVLADALADRGVGFISELMLLGADELLFREAVIRYLDTHLINGTVRDIVMEVIEGS